MVHEKCQKLTIGKTAVSSHFILENTFPIEVAVVKDLGIHISANMKWENHIIKIKKQAFQRCYHEVIPIKKYLDSGQSFYSPHL